MLEQVTAARDQVQEFQAHFVTISGKRFMSFDKLYPQEDGSFCERIGVGVASAARKVSVWHAL